MDHGERTVGFLYQGAPTQEQVAAETWLAAGDRFGVETVELGSIADGGGDLDRFDALWLHADVPIRRNAWLRESGVSDAIREFVSDSGGLLLSHLAVTAVVDLGFDALAPDTVVPATGTTASGFLAKALHRDHPIFDGVQGLRYPTEGPGERTSLARYEQRLPEAGEILAGNYVEGEDVPHEATVIEWQEGEGVVIGVGSHLGFYGAGRNPYRPGLSRFATDLLSYLTDRTRQKQPMTAHLRTPEEFRRVRALVDDDPHRPRYHFCPPANWQNDPSGIVERDGAYHLFYNHNPAGPYHGTIHGVPNVKGHAVSSDLLRWEDRPIALWPTAGGPDEQGIWTGCVVDDDGDPTFVYTGARGGERYSTAGRQRPCLAVATDDDLSEWEKHPTPIVAEPPEDIDVVSRNWEGEFRDHCVWREEGTWYQIVGTGIDGEGGAALLYRSDDLRKWEFLNPLLVGDGDETGPVWECPELFSLGDRHVLHVSTNGAVYYFVGEFDGRKIHPDRRGILDYGGFYAPQSVADSNGRRVMFGWVRSGRHTSTQWDAGWAGAMTIPRVLDLDRDGRLVVEPAAEIESLRGERVHERDRELESGTEIQVESLSGTAFEFDLELDPCDATEVGIVLRRSPDDEERTPIRYRADEERLTVDRGRTSRSAAVDARSRSMPAPLDDDGRLRVRGFLDRSVLELFVGDRACLTTRVYPTRADSTGVSLYSLDGGAIASIDAWPMESVW